MTTMRAPHPRRRTLLAAGGAAPLISMGLSSCQLLGGPKGTGEVGEPDIKAELPREDPGPADGAGRSIVPFTARMLGGVGKESANVVCSPLSAQVALTMAGMGAVGGTRAQMEQVLGGTMDELAQASNTISSVLDVVGDEEREADDEDAPEPAVASLVNGVWAQEGMSIEEPFLEALAVHFGSGVYEADFIDEGAREKARERINNWVEDATRDLIAELIGENVLTEDSRMVLVNALHLKAAWPDELNSHEGAFTVTDGSEIQTEMLSGETYGWYEDDLCRAATLGTYGGDLALALVQPTEDVHALLEVWTDAADDPAAGLGALLQGWVTSQKVEVTLPAFDIEWKGLLSQQLKRMGMEQAFSESADFSGITQDEQLLISEVVQKAVITVDKEGMEAAAATAVMVGNTAAPAEPKELTLDRPFVFIAYETSTRAPLVLGWIGDPSSQTR